MGGGGATGGGGSGGSAAGGSAASGGSAGSGAGGSGVAGAAGEAGEGGSGGSDPLPEPKVAMFISDRLNDAVYRYTIAPGAAPVLTETLSVPTATGIALSGAGELFVAEYSAAGDIRRFQAPFFVPQENGTIAGVGAQYPHFMTFVDDELWVLNSAFQSCDTGPQGIVRLGFAAGGQASALGTVTGLIGANRGMLWDARTRQLFVSQCYGVNTIQRLRVGVDHSTTALPTIAASANPHGMIMSAGGDLLVAGAGTPIGGTSLWRFSFDANDVATPNGSITGNGLSTPIGLSFTPWGELYVVNQGDAPISRFTFDASDQATPNGNVPLSFPTQAGVAGVGWILIAEEPQ